MYTRQTQSDAWKAPRSCTGRGSENGFLLGLKVAAPLAGCSTFFPPASDILVTEHHGGTQFSASASEYKQKRARARGLPRCSRCRAHTPTQKYGMGGGDFILHTPPPTKFFCMTSAGAGAGAGGGDSHPLNCKYVCGWSCTVLPCGYGAHVCRAPAKFGCGRCGCGRFPPLLFWHHPCAPPVFGDLGRAAPPSARWCGCPCIRCTRH